MRARVGSSLPLSRLVLCLACAALVPAGLVHPSIVRPLNIEDLAQRADRIFSGRCVDVHEVRDAALGQTVTYTTFVVTRAVKGALHGRLTIRSLGGATAGGSGPDPIPACVLKKASKRLPSTGR